MSARAGIVVTGTEVLTGRITDRNGPWLSDRLRELGVDLAYNVIVADRRDDLEAALTFLARRGVQLIITSGGLGPTEDDLTAEVVGGFQGREMVLDEALERRIGEILRPLLARWPNLDPAAVLASNRKQAIVPAGATILEPVGTAPGLVVTPAAGPGPTVVVLPGPPRELQTMWQAALATDALAAIVAAGTAFELRTLRLYGPPESAIADTLRAAEAAHGLEGLEITTCVRRGELEVVTRFEPGARATYDALERTVRERHAGTVFSDDERTIDELVADLLLERGTTIATAESCTGGLLAARLTERAGASQYVSGGVVVYDNAAKVAVAGVAAELIERHGAVSREVAEALADGARARFAADIGVGVTGIAGPDGGTAEKSVGFVCLSVVSADGRRLTRSPTLPGNRAEIRDRSTTAALHLVRELLTS